MPTRNKLNGIESKILEALINNHISHEDFMTVINEKKKYRGLKKSIRMMNSQKSDVQKIINTYTYKMKSYCLKCRKDTENINPKVSSTSNGKAMILSKCAICGSKKSRFIKNQEAKGIRTPLFKVPILEDILF